MSDLEISAPAPLSLTCRHCSAPLVVDVDDDGNTAWVDARNSDLCPTEEYQLHHPLPSSDAWQTQSPVKAGHWVECVKELGHWVVYERFGPIKRWVRAYTYRPAAEEAVVALAAERLEALSVTA